MVRLTLDEQIIVLLYARKLCKEHDKQSSFSSGMCHYIINSLYKFHDRYSNSSGIEMYIPTFNLSNIKKLTSGTKLYPDEEEFDPYWWDRENNKVRVEVFNLLLDELESNRSFLYKWYKRLTYLFK